MTGVELLRAEIETLWVSDESGRLLNTREPNGLLAPYLVLAVAAEGQCLALGAEVPGALAQELEKAVSGTAAPHDPTEQPSALARCMELLQDAVGPVELSSGPSYVVPRAPHFSRQPPLYGPTRRMPRCCVGVLPPPQTGARTGG